MAPIHWLWTQHPPSITSALQVLECYGPLGAPGQGACQLPGTARTFVNSLNCPARGTPSVSCRPSQPTQAHALWSAGP